MEKIDQNRLLSKVSDLGQMSADEARGLLDEIFEDGISSRNEAEAVFALNRQLDDFSPDWNERFCSMLKDFLLTAEAPVGWMDEQECTWLINQIGRHGIDVTLNEVDLLLVVLPHAEGAPVAVAKCALAAISALAKRKMRMSAKLVARMRILLRGCFGVKSAWITQWEAQSLQDINDSIGFARNDAGWKQLYARAIANHLMARAHPAPEEMADGLDRSKWLSSEPQDGLGGMYLLSIQSTDDGNWFEQFSSSTAAAKMAHKVAREQAVHAGTLSDEDDDWLTHRLGWGSNVSPAERALVGFLKDEAPGFAHGLTTAISPDQSVTAMAFS